MSQSLMQMKHHIVHGLRPEYTPFVTLNQGWEWDQQPVLEEFENLLSSQESLAIQMAGVSMKEEMSCLQTRRFQRTRKKG